MRTITVSIGNSDNKLTQRQWSEFVNHIDSLIREISAQVHFFGGSPNWERWQNTAWVFDCAREVTPDLKNSLKEYKQMYKQDSIAYIEGETEFL